MNLYEIIVGTANEYFPRIMTQETVERFAMTVARRYKTEMAPRDSELEAMVLHLKAKLYDLSQPKRDRDNENRVAAQEKADRRWLEGVQGD